VLTTVLCGVPPVAVMVAGTSGVLVKAKLAVLDTPVAVAVTL